jgi:L-fucose isomerase-like protein
MIGCLLGNEVPYICENDLVGAATHVILNKLISQTVAFLETYEFWKEKQSILLGACGVVPPSMVDGPLQARSFSSALFQGMGSVSRMKTGRMTLARLIPGKDRFAMHIVTGEACAPPDWVELGYTLPSHPSVELKLDGNLNDFVEAVSAQHFSVAYGDHAESLTELCDSLGLSVLRT